METNTIRHRVVAMLAAGVVLAGCSSSPPAAQPSVSFGAGAPANAASPTGSPVAVAGDAVSIDDFAFAPATLTVPVGGSVVWTNRDEEPRTVAATDGSFRSPGMGTGATFSHTFTAAGRFDYVCSIHPMMHGTVVVTG